MKYVLPREFLVIVLSRIFRGVNNVTSQIVGDFDLIRKRWFEGPASEPPDGVRFPLRVVDRDSVHGFRGADKESTQMPLDRINIIIVCDE